MLVVLWSIVTTFVKVIAPDAVSAVSLLRNEEPCTPSSKSASRPEPEPSFPDHHRPKLFLKLVGV